VPAEAPVVPGAHRNPAPVLDTLGEDFPGCRGAGRRRASDDPFEPGWQDPRADLVAIPGIGAKTADKILAAV
jgi:endonuclease III